MIRRYVVGVALLVVVAGGCGSGSQTRTVLVDYSHDEFATMFLEYFPKKVTLHPGDTIVFKQTWTGEPHSVTLGTVVDEMGDLMRPWLEKVRAEGWEALPDEPPAELEEIFQKLPWMFTDDEETGEMMVAQNAAQPCYLDEGLPPEDADIPCDPEDQEQPAFNGRQSYYNSGFIPYEGPSGNTFTMTLAEDIEPGTYFYYCNLHGPFQSGEIEVVDADTPIPSQADVNRQARAEIEEQTAPLREMYRSAAEGQFEVPDPADKLRELGLTRARGGTAYVDAFFSGLPEPEDVYVHGAINEFVPREITAKAGEQISWMWFGSHTISFNVPEYFPIVEIDDDGTVRWNPDLEPAAGGAPDPPPPPDGPPGDDPPEPLIIDAGQWDGDGFWSSGIVEAWAHPYVVYQLTITAPGTYRYACLIHPPMVGTLTVIP